MSDNSMIRQVVDSIVKKLSDHEYFRTSPKIPVIAEDIKDIDKTIIAAMQSAGVHALVSFQSGETDSPNTVGPYLSDSTFQVTVSEIPSVWRSNKMQSTPSCTMIAEACARILHHHTPVDASGNALTGGVLIFSGMTQLANDSMLQQAITFTLPVPLSNTSPTR